MNYFDHPEFCDHEFVSFVYDNSSGLKAIIAIHDTTLGGLAGGGIRMQNYASDEMALGDAFRLSRTMTYKAALAGLALGGAKTIVIGNPETDKTPELLTALAKAINTLGGYYRAGEDVGTNSDDMQIINRTTTFVASGPVDGNVFTALGVYLAMRVAVKMKLGRENLCGVSVALQGMGKVAYELACLLKKDGAEIYAADINSRALEKAVENLGVKPIAVDEIAYQDVDIFSPCALGAILNEMSIPKLQAGIVCGAANNQLATEVDDKLMRSRNILYLPDFVVNAGGVISGFSMEQEGITDHDTIARRVSRIAITAKKVIDLSEKENIGTQEAAYKLAEGILNHARS